MKKLIYISLITLGLINLGACTKEFLELEPKTSKLEANAYKTEGDALLALTAVYDAFSVQNWMFVPLMADIRSDDVFAGGDASGSDMIQWQDMERFDMDADNASASELWNRCYSGIYRANQLLEKVDGIEWQSDANKERVVAEARFLRAYFYWDLVRHYGWVPILTKVESDIDALTNIPQSTPQEVYKQVATDLLASADKLPATVPAVEAGRVTKYAAYALMARIYMYYEGFAKPVLSCTGDLTDGTTAITKAFVVTKLDEIINSGAHALLPTYGAVFAWNNENNNESIFSIQYDGASGATDWGGWGINGNFTALMQGPRDPSGDPEVTAGWSFGVMSFDLANSFEATDSRSATVLYDANAKLSKYTRGFQNTGFFNYKFIPRAAYISAKGDPAHNFPINYPDIRYADVLLMAAELNIDNNGKAAGYLNQVRTRAGLGTKATITLDDVYAERRLELAGEGHRYWDLLRRGLNVAEAAINASFTGIPGKANVNKPDFAVRAFNPATYGMFPIPAGEIRNTNGKLQQFIPAYK